MSIMHAQNWHFTWFYSLSCYSIRIKTCVGAPFLKLHAMCRPVYLFTCPPIYLSACRHVDLSACRPVDLSTCRPVDMSACRPVCVPTCLSVYMSTCLPICVPTCRPVYVSTCRPVCVSTCLQVLRTELPMPTCQEIFDYFRPNNIHKLERISSEKLDRIYSRTI